VEAVARFGDQKDPYQCYANYRTRRKLLEAMMLRCEQFGNYMRLLPGAIMDIYDWYTMGLGGMQSARGLTKLGGSLSRGRSPGAVSPRP
jgi:hypothetical protein